MSSLSISKMAEQARLSMAVHSNVDDVRESDLGL